MTSVDALQQAALIKLSTFCELNHRNGRPGSTFPSSAESQARSSCLHKKAMADIKPAATLSTPLYKTLTISDRRGVDLNLSNLAEHIGPIPAKANAMSSASPTLYTTGSDGVSISGLPSNTIRSTSCGPLTPPLDFDSSVWFSTTAKSVPNTRSASSVPRSTRRDGEQREIPQGSHQQAVGPIAGDIETSSLNFSTSPWFLRAMKLATESLGGDVLPPSVKVISQVLPPNTTDHRAVKTYEMVCNYLQTAAPEPPYISITHALTVSPSQTVEDFPKSPPVTPNISSGDSYFAEQTVFTHAAQVPNHHNIGPAASGSPALSQTPQRNIMMAEAHLVLLERFIPPSTAGEVADFFGADMRKSYLADRLPELALETGSLLLIYPTKAGGQTFAREYVAPILDPLLREMSILKGLNTSAAERLGNMKGAAAMYDIVEMTSKVEAMCKSLNRTTQIRKTRSTFSVVHAQTAHVILDRESWMSWFIEQEQQRMKKDLTEYHREGGRLPHDESNEAELTVGMLTREITEAFRRSTASAGDTGIEVGVIVVRRHKNIA